MADVAPTIERNLDIVSPKSTERKALSDTEKTRIAVARKIAAEKGAREALKFVTSTPLNPRSLAEGKFHPEKVSASGATFSAEQLGELGRIKTAIMLSNMLLENKFDSIPDSLPAPTPTDRNRRVDLRLDKAALKSWVRDSLLRQTAPEVASYFVAHPGEVDAMVKQILNDPSFAHLFRGEIIDASSKGIDEGIAREHQQAEKAFRDAEEAYKATKAATERAESDYDARFGATGAYTLDLNNMSNLETDEQNINAIIATQNAILSNPAATPVQKNDARDERTRRMADLAVLRPKLERTRGLKNQQLQLQSELRQKEDTATAARAKRNKAQSDFFIVRTRLRQAEMEYADGISQAATKAAVKYMEGKYTKANEGQTATLQGEEELRTNRFDGAIENAKQYRWERYGRRRIRGTGGRVGYIFTAAEKRPIRAQIERDVKLLIVDSQGADKLLRKVLEGYKEGTGREAKSALSSQEIDEKLKDAGWVHAKKVELAEQLFTEYLRIGGRFRESDARFIQATPWGQGLLQKALENKANQENVRGFLKENGIFDADIKDGIDKLLAGKSGKDIKTILFLLSLLGAGAVGAVAAPVLGATALAGAMGGGGAVAGGGVGLKGVNVFKNYART